MRNPFTRPHRDLNDLSKQRGSLDTGSQEEFPRRLSGSIAVERFYDGNRFNARIEKEAEA